MNQQLKESLEEFDKKFLEDGPLTGKKYLNGYIDSTSNDIKQFITTHTKKLLQAEIEILEGMKKSCGDPMKFRLSDEDIGYNIALQDQISHLQEQIIKLKE